MPTDRPTDQILDDAPTLPGVVALVELPDADGPAPCSGRAFGRYVVEEMLGRGGMGVVYLAYDRNLRRHVAMKILSEELKDNRSFLDRFVAEAQVTAQLQHPAIVPVFDIGLTDHNEFFYTMRLVRGQTLARLVRDVVAGRRPTVGPDDDFRWTRFRLLEVFVRICLAVAYAHERGVVHRDLKPQNVMIGHFNEVHVMDWGLAKVFAGAARRTAPRDASKVEAPIALTTRKASVTDSLLGTPAYMAPEQVDRDPEAIGPVTDVYALGAILYAILTGNAPYRGDTSEILIQLAEGKPPPVPRAIEIDVPAELEAICLRALAHDPAARFPNASMLGEEVESFLEARPVGSQYLQTEERIPSQPWVTINVVVLCQGGSEKPVHVLLQRRQRSPYLGWWGLPGVRLGRDDSLEATARRSLEDAGLSASISLERLGTYENLEPDATGRRIAIVYVAVLAVAVPPVNPRPQEVATAWVSAEFDGAGGVRLGPEVRHSRLAFDDGTIVADSLAWIATHAGRRPT
ncbi:protein kinase [Planctomycetota bacterium]